MSLFNVRRGAKKAFRKVVTQESDGDEEESTPKAEGVQSHVPSAKPVQPHVQTSSVILSFADEGDGTEGGESFGSVNLIKKKRRDHERRLAKMMDREKKKKSKELINSVSTASMRSKSAPTQVKVESPRQEDKEDESEESDDPEGRILVGDDAVEDHEMGNLPQLGPGVIPDSATIHAVKKHRELLRTVGHKYVPSQAPPGRPKDFIPLSAPYRAKTSDSRLVREDENDRSDEDDEDGKPKVVMNFGPNKEPTKQFQVLSALEGMHSDEDDEMTKWEEEQISKGIKASQSQSQDVDPFQIAQFQYGNQASSQIEGGPGAYPVSYESRRPLPPRELVPVTLESLKQRLSKHLGELNEELSVHRQSLERTEDDLVTYAEDIGHFDESTAALGEAYKFFQETRGYVNNLLGCLSEKVLEVNDLEEKVIHLWFCRSEALITRRQQDVEDMMEECSRLDGHANPVTPEVNEFGQDLNQLKEEARKRRMADRLGRRRRRREKKQEYGELEPEGLSTDDEETESDKQRLNLELNKLKLSTEEIFNDVVEEFSSIPLIMAHFEKWKSDHLSSYQKAFISLFVPKLFVPFVKLQMIMWNPLQDSCKDLEEYPWFQDLLFFGSKENSPVDETDEDNLLLPNIIELAVLPKLKVLAEKVWDPLSTVETNRFIKFVRNLQVNFPTISSLSKPLEALYSAVILRMRRCLDKDIYIPLYSKKHLEKTTSLHSQFYSRQFWKAVKLFSNISLWSCILSEQSVKELALDGLLNRYILLALQNLPIEHSCVEKCEAVVDKIPNQWTGNSMDFQGLIRYLRHLQMQLKSNTQAQLATSKMVGQDVKRLNKLLKRIGDEQSKGIATN